MGTRTGGEARFRRHHELVAQATRRDELAQHLLASPAGVNIGRVDEIAPGSDIGFEDSARADFV